MLSRPACKAPLVLGGLLGDSKMALTAIGIKRLETESTEERRGSSLGQARRFWQLGLPVFFDLRQTQGDGLGIHGRRELADAAKFGIQWACRGEAKDATHIHFANAQNAEALAAQRGPIQHLSPT